MIFLNKLLNSFSRFLPTCVIRSIIISSVLILLNGCSETPPDENLSAPLVVEGWIEEGETPVVMVTRAVDMTKDISSFDGMVERWCRVSVYDNGERHLLYGLQDSRYMPPFVYTTPTLRGVPGHTYRLMVETESDTVMSECTLPASTLIDRLEPYLVAGSESEFALKLYLKECDRGAYYKVFAKVHDSESRYYPAFMGTFSGQDYDPSNGYTVTRGLRAGYEAADFSHYFSAGDKVTVKVCTITEPLYEFWRTYDSNVSLAGNLFFTFASNCPHTVSGGFGYWGAYGMTMRSIEIPRQ